jgi:hypothetical protein
MRSIQLAELDRVDNLEQELRNAQACAARRLDRIRALEEALERVEVTCAAISGDEPQDPSHETKFYGVHAGRTPGVYTSWREARREVDGFATPPLIEPKNGSNQLSFAKALLGSWRPLFLSAGGTVSVVWRTLSSCHSPWIVCRHPFHEGRGGDGRPCRCSITRPLSLASSPSSTSSALNTSAFLLSPGSPLPSLQV